MQIRVVIRWSPRFMALHGRTVGHVVDRLCCLIAGHKDEVTVCRRNLALHCARCGRVSPGWQLDTKWPV